MSEWTTAHPYLTTLLILVTLECIFKVVYLIVTGGREGGEK